MSNDLSFREKLERRAATLASGRAVSSSPVELHVAMALPFPHGIAFAKLLASSGLGLADAHKTLGQLVKNQTVTVMINQDDADAMVVAMEDMGLTVSVLQPYATRLPSRVP